MTTITPCLWFDTQGEEAAEFYTSIFKNSRVLDVSRYGEAGRRDAGTVMTVAFELDGQRFVALNGGPQFTFSEAISFQLPCESQEEIDEYWTRLGDGGQAGPCGWMKDRFGISWQIFPTRLTELLGDPDAERSDRVMRAMLEMGKLDLAALEQAAAGVARTT
jgi:predicted 3-demethylubiquinone-9 3-methyltransferase (glyoxalase superfamily)